ncbi:MAG TPA: BatD family protein [Spirochaetota bacterium]|nr:BatD family protein [Spirochaetota bacterium]
MRTITVTTITLLIAAPALFGLSAKTVIEPARVRVGEAATLLITIDGADVPDPVSVPEVEGLSIAFTGTRRSFQFINGKAHSETAVTFRVVPERSGSFAIPPVVLKRGGETIRSSAVTFLAYAGSAHSPRGTGPVGGLVRVSKQNVVAGEPVLLRFYLVHTGVDITRATVFDKMPAVRGFLLKQVDETLPDESVRTERGEFIKSHVATFAAVPLESGRFAVGGGSVSVTVAETDPGSFFPFVVPSTRRVDFDTIAVMVNPLPAAGRPAGFRGDVGIFSLKAEFPDQAFSAFTEFRLKVKVAGRGNLLSLSRPEYAKVDGLSIIGSDGAVRLAVANGSIEGEREFIFTIIPQRPGSFILPGLGLSFFNPASGRYELARTADHAFEAAPGAGARKGPGHDDTGEKSQGLEFDPLPVMGIILLAAGGVAAAVWWRRRVSMASPEPGPEAEASIARAPARSKDRRADLANAARRRDAGSFLKTAACMLDEACAAVWYGGADESVKRGIDDLKRRVYLHRYAGRALSDLEMDELYRRLREIFR